MAVEVKQDTLERKMESWDIMDRHDERNFLQSAWEFKCKHFTYGAIRNIKLIFCVRGDQQVKGVEFFETFPHVVPWTKIRPMMVLSLMLGLKTTQADITAAFSTHLWKRVRRSMLKCHKGSAEKEKSIS